MAAEMAARDLRAVSEDDSEEKAEQETALVLAARDLHAESEDDSEEKAERHFWRIPMPRALPWMSAETEFKLDEYSTLHTYCLATAKRGRNKDHFNKWKSRADEHHDRAHELFKREVDEREQKLAELNKAHLALQRQKCEAGFPN